jgi:hypothetical protein
MNEDKRLSDEALRTVAAEQDAFLAQHTRSTDAVAEEAMRRSWKPSRRMRLVPTFSAAGVAAMVAFGVAFVVARAGRNDLSFEVAGRIGHTGTSLTAQAGAPLPLRFSDGSVLVFQPGTQARVARLSDNGAELLLDSGRLVADVRHTGQAHWSVVAGPFRVRVTGTRFVATWSPIEGALAVAMVEGSVVVEGPALGQGLTLGRGDTLEVGISSPPVVTRTQPAPVVPTPEASAASVRPEPTPPATAEPPVTAGFHTQASWSELASNRRYADALVAAEHEGFSRLCRQLDASALLALGDAARYASSPGRARQAFEALVRRFPRDQRSHDALFALGRLESEAGAPLAAARWFERYLATARNPPLAEEADGRLVEIYDQEGDAAAAARAARGYLERHPDGPRAARARKVLAGHQVRR